MRLTLGQVKASRIPKWLGICADDPRLVQWVNEATQRLLHRGLWWGTYASYRICIDNGCLTWPRQIAAIETMAVCGLPVQIRNEWFEYLQAGPGLQVCDNGNCNSGLYGSCRNQMYDRGMVVTFADIIGVNKKVKVYIDNANDASKKILIQGFDENGNWILTNNGATQGEEVTLAASPVTTTNFFSSITGIQKEETLGNVRIYEYDTDLTTQRALGIYEPTETLPSYRRSFINGLVFPASDDDDETCEQKTVTVMAKLEFIPVAVDQDYLIIGNINAIKLAAKAMQLEENNQLEESTRNFAIAIDLLDKELDHYLGAQSATISVNTDGPVGANVGNLI